MMYPSKISAAEKEEQLIQMAAMYKESSSWSEFKIKIAAAGLQSKLGQLYFWAYYVAHNTTLDPIDRIIAYSAIVGAAVCAVATALFNFFYLLSGGEYTHAVIGIQLFATVLFGIIAWIAIYVFLDLCNNQANCLLEMRESTSSGVSI